MKHCTLSARAFASSCPTYAGMVFRACPRGLSILEASERRGDQVHFLFMGACEHDVDFKFLRTIAARFKNTGVVIVHDLDGFVDLSDEEINTQLLGPELLAWLRS
ncbi:MAG: hypothetical protein ABI414_01770 [Devosia sp.]